MSRARRRAGACWCTKTPPGASRAMAPPRTRVRTSIPYGASDMSWSAFPTASSSPLSCSRARASTRVPISSMGTIYPIRRRCIPAPGFWSRCPTTGPCTRAAATPASSRRIFPAATRGLRTPAEQGQSSRKNTLPFRHRACPFRRRHLVSEANPPRWRRSPTSAR